MSEESTPRPARISAEEHSRPVFRLLARAFILLARQQADEQPPGPADPDTDKRGGDHADA